jgi:hypothetical protein
MTLSHLTDRRGYEKLSVRIGMRLLSMTRLENLTSGLGIRFFMANFMDGEKKD